MHNVAINYLSGNLFDSPSVQLVKVMLQWMSWLTLGGKQLNMVADLCMWEGHNPF